MNKKSVNNLLPQLLVILFLLIPQIIYIFNMPYKEFLALKIIFSICLTICIVNSLFYILFAKVNDNLNIKKYYFFVTLILVLVYSPILFKGYFFQDDFINFIGYNQNYFRFTISQGREITGLLTDYFSFITIENSYILRFFSVTIIIFYALLLFKILVALIDPFKALFLALAFTVLVPVLNVASYGSMFCYSLAFLLSAISVIHFKNAILLNDYRIYNIIMCIFNIIVANFIYQVSATVGFFILILIIIFNGIKKDKVITVGITYIIAYGLSTGIYMILVKILAYYSDIAIMTRGNIVKLNQIGPKIIWFIKVIGQNFKQIIGSFLSNNFFTTKWMNYNLDFKYERFEYILYIFILLIILIYIINELKNKNYKKLIIITIYIPMSFYPFLILEESSYTSYYSVALCSTLFLLFYKGISIFINKIKIINNNTLITVMLSFMLLSSNYYLHDFWVEYNRFGYEYLKHNIKISLDDKVSNIHVYGYLFPEQADIYMKNATKMAYLELGVDKELIPNITTTSNKHYVNTINAFVWNDMQKLLNEDEIIWIDSMYTKIEEFDVYTLNTEKLDEMSILQLQTIFYKCNILPSNNDTKIIDMQYF